ADIAVVSPADIWAVGYVEATNMRQTLVEHWNGIQWAIVPSPNVVADHNTLYGVTSISATDVWAVGYHEDPNVGVSQVLTMHWDGIQWSIVSAPNVGQYSNSLRGV